MQFNSLIFALFFLVSFFIYWLLQQKYRWFILILASILFYASFGLQLIPFLIITVLILYIEGRQLEKHKNIYLFAISIISMLLPLLLFKYLGFFLEHLVPNNNSFLLIHSDLVKRIGIPVGLSFYTFTTISYLTDVFRGTIPAERHLGYLTLYLIYFPKIIAGPVEKSYKFLEKLKEPIIFNESMATYGMMQLLWGIYKKYVVADTLGLGVDVVYNNLTHFKGFVLVVVSIMYTFQIYFDFSGYSDMALGISKMFGIELGINFKNPYFSSSFKEFWSRWHISLTGWLKDYVYIPLGGNRKGKIRQSINILITFLLSGIWHGANITFLIWGGLHGCAQVIENLFKRNRTKPKGLIMRFIGLIITFLGVNALWVLFRAPNISSALYLYKYCLQGITNPIGYILEIKNYLNTWIIGVSILFAEVALIFVIDFLQEKKNMYLWLLGQKEIIQWLYFICMILLIILLYPKGVTEQFIYAQF